MSKWVVTLWVRSGYTIASDGVLLVESLKWRLGEEIF
jgi:hypothetical protein